LDDFESIQGRFGAALIRVPSSTAHSGIRRELGLKPLKTLIYKKKMLYMQRIASLDDSIWVKKAYLECQLAKGKSPTHDLAHLQIDNNKTKGQWLSSWRSETDKIVLEIKTITDTTIDCSMTPKRISKVMDQFKFKIEKTLMDKLTQNSLKWLPKYQPTAHPQPYLLIDDEDVRTTLAKFRLGNAGLGNRSSGRVLQCPACDDGPNNESHLALKCKAPDIANIKNKFHTNVKMNEFLQNSNGIVNDEEKLQMFLPGPIDVLYARGNYLLNILKVFKESYCLDEGNNEDQPSQIDTGLLSQGPSNQQHDHNYYSHKTKSKKKITPNNKKL
jgi:hypothetical protein